MTDYEDDECLEAAIEDDSGAFSDESLSAQGLTITSHTEPLKLPETAPHYMLEADFLKLMARLSEPNELGCVHQLSVRDGRTLPKPSINLSYGVNISSRRVIWEAHNGELSDKEAIRATCENPNCIALEHLYTGKPSKRRKQPQPPKYSGYSNLLEEQEAHQNAIKSRCVDLAFRAYDDCWHFCREFYASGGLVIDPLGTFNDGQFKRVSEPRDGDLIMVGMDKSGRFSHAGISIFGGILHHVGKSGVLYEKIKVGRINEQQVRYYRPIPN